MSELLSIILTADSALIVVIIICTAIFSWHASGLKKDLKDHSEKIKELDSLPKSVGIIQTQIESNTVSMARMWGVINDINGKVYRVLGKLDMNGNNK